MRIRSSWCLPLVLLVAAAACSKDGGDDGVGGDAVVYGTRVHPMPMKNRIIQQPGEDPAFMYFGGPVIQHAKVVEVLWGGGVAFSTELGRFYAAITDSEYFDLLAEYGTSQKPIGHGSYAGLVTHPAPPAGSTVDDEVVQKELAKLLHQGTLPANDDDTVYMVHFPPGVTIMQGGAASCANFCAYHGSFRRNDKLVPYVVVPDMGGDCSVGCGSADKMSNTTWVASHELAQVVTNPSIGFAGKEPSAPMAWFDPLIGELSDACGGSAQIDGYVVQTQWSKKDAKCRFGGSQAGSFTIGVSPTAQTVRSGTSATLVVTTTATAPSPPMVTLDATGLPEGVTATFMPAAIVAGKSAVMTVEAAASAPGATADVTVIGRGDDSSMQSTTAKLTVDSPRPGNDFSLSVTPVSQTVRRGATVKLSVKTAVVTGDAEPIMLTIAGLPGGVTGSFMPMIIVAGSSSELTVNAGPAATVGSVLLTVTATARAKTRTATVSLDVEDIPPANDFALGILPAMRTVMAGRSETFTVTTMVTSGQAQTIMLGASGLPPGLSFTFSPSSVPAGDSAQLTVTATADAGAASAPFTVTGTAPSGSRTTTATITVTPAPPANDFSVAVTPSSRSVAAGDATTYTVNTAVTSGNAVMVAFAISGLPQGVSAVFEPPAVMAGDSATLRVTVDLDAAVGSAPLTITFCSSTSRHPASSDLTVTPPPANDFSISVSPPIQNVTAGQMTTFAVSTAVTSGRAETIALTVSSLPTGVTGEFTPSSVTAGGTSTLKLTAALSAKDANDVFNVKGTSPSFNHSTSGSLTVTSLPPPNDFSLTVAPDSHSVLPGAMVTYTITTAVTSGSAQSVALGVEGLPAGVTGSITPMSVTAGNSATLTLSASPTAPVATKTFTVNGTAASGSRLDTAEVVVLPPPITNLIVNGTFETGDLSGWDIDVGTATNASVAHHGGDHSAKIGSSTLYVYDSALYQLVEPPSGKKTTLTFWVYPRCPEVWGSQQAYILDDGGFVVKTIFDDCSDSGAWEKITVDLSAYAGKSVYFYARIRDYGFAATWMYLDDVEALAQ